jgi:hypothetical protein
LPVSTFVARIRHFPGGIGRSEVESLRDRRASQEDVRRAARNDFTARIDQLGRFEYEIKLSVKSLHEEGFTAGMAYAQSLGQFNELCKKAKVLERREEDGPAWARLVVTHATGGYGTTAAFAWLIRKSASSGSSRRRLTRLFAAAVTFAT